MLKKHEEKTSIRIYVNKIENRITIKIKTGYYLELLNLLGPQAPCNSFLRFFFGSFVFDINYEKL